MDDEKKIWITDTSMVKRGDGSSMFLNISMQNIPFSITNYAGINQVHMSISQDDLLLLKKAIDKLLEKTNEIVKMDDQNE